jgi:hypothetical protein
MVARFFMRAYKDVMNQNSFIRKGWIITKVYTIIMIQSPDVVWSGIQIALSYSININIYQEEIKILSCKIF